MRRLLWLLVVALAAGCAENPDGPTAESRLVSVDWLEDNLDEENLIVVDARPTHEYLAGHIPGAISASFPEEDATSNGVYVSYGGGLDLWVDNDNPITSSRASRTPKSSSSIRCLPHGTSAATSPTRAPDTFLVRR
jgi:rhodanese-related sulfurtransferase